MNKRSSLAKIAFLALILCQSAFDSRAQQQTGGELQPKKVQPCELTLSDAPIVRGIRFEMSKEEAENALGIKMLNGSNLSEDRQIGLETLTFFRNRVNKYPTPLDGVEIIELKFFNNKLYSFIFSFDDSSKWQDVASFTASLSNEFKLPQSWQAESSFLARMNCLSFNATANIYLLPELSFINVQMNREIESRRNEARTNRQRRDP